jgi:hypothetical protein
VLGLYFELRKPELQMYLVEKHRKEGQKWNDNCELDVVHVAVVFFCRVLLWFW